MPDMEEGSLIFDVTVPFPPAILNPNSRSHWAKKANAAKAYGSIVNILTRAWIQRQDSIQWIQEAGRLHLWLYFMPPDRRKRDDDNLVRAFKSGRDAISSALGINDAVFRTHAMIGARSRPFSVRVMITEKIDHPTPSDLFGP